MNTAKGPLPGLKKRYPSPPVLTRPVEGEILQLYLFVSEEVLSVVLIRETEEGHQPVCFVSRALQGPEVRYQKVEKAALALVLSACRLSPYFVATRLSYEQTNTRLPYEQTNLYDRSCTNQTWLED